MNDPPNTPIRRGVVAVIVRDGRFLLIRRAASVVAPGAYCFPGGAIEGDESEPDALVRELHEELGVGVRPLRRVWASVTPWNVALGWWLADLAPGAVLSPNRAEVASVHWLTSAEMRELPELLVSNGQFLAALDLSP